MPDTPSLDDIARFQKIMETGTFAEAARALGIPKSTLSKSIARLERNFGLRLLERTTRKLRATEAGRMVAQHSKEMVAAYQAACLAASATIDEPAGQIRVSCPPGLVENLIDGALLSFLERYPRIDIDLKVTGRPVDLIEDNVDIAFRARSRLEAGSSFVVRRLGNSRGIVVAAPAFLQDVAPVATPSDIRGAPAVIMSGDIGSWRLIDELGTSHQVTVSPRLTTGDLGTLRKAAIRGIGLAQLPEHLCSESVAEGSLMRVLPDFSTVSGTIYAVFSRETARTPALRAFVDHMVAEFRDRLLPDGKRPRTP